MIQVMLNDTIYSSLSLLKPKILLEKKKEHQFSDQDIHFFLTLSPSLNISPLYNLLPIFPFFHFSNFILLPFPSHFCFFLLNHSMSAQKGTQISDNYLVIIKKESDLPKC